MLSQTVDLAPNQSVEVPFNLAWNTCGTFDAFTCAGAVHAFGTAPDGVDGNPSFRY